MIRNGCFRIEFLKFSKFLKFSNFYCFFLSRPPSRQHQSCAADIWEDEREGGGERERRKWGREREREREE
jgi:hypothetical protein